MIEVVVGGSWRGSEERGDWAWIARQQELVLGEGSGSGRPDAIESALGAELAALTHAIEEVARSWAGEEVVVRTASASLGRLFSAWGPGVRGDAARWLARLGPAAKRLAELRVTVVPAPAIERVLHYPSRRRR